ncbi:hypothetical protein AB0A74_01130 [Saccharothrix sp. NPDC042600]|uniref:hypothetical protein n=1 Tax=Saccharothrix TaxID=2071 RepID=UPI0033DCD44D|nr:hypothetical protein GCM10017745_49300 [Saccharothrix mutabilis subsp. capreolus]
MEGRAAIDSHTSGGPATPGGPDAEDPAPTAELLRRWERLSRQAGWSTELHWLVPEVERVAAAVVVDAPLDDPVYDLGHRRGADGANTAELEADIRGFTLALRETGRVFPPADVLLARARLGMDAANAAAILESTFVDPYTGLASPRGLAATLAADVHGSRHHHRALWICAWAGTAGPWRTIARHVEIAESVRPLLGAADAASFLGAATIAVVTDDASRYTGLRDAIAALPGVDATDARLHEVPRLDTWQDAFTWLLRASPELATALLADDADAR